MLKRQIRFDPALTPDAECLDDRTELASGRCQTIFEDAWI
jgi:hypothetical protein